MGAAMVVAWLLMSCVIAYFSIQVTIGIWFPTRATARQRALVGSLPVQVMHPFFKWLCPLMAITMPLGILSAVVSLLTT
jgi:hypothetical protein